jgi:REP element-mobilizing transposase RayT
MTLVRPIVPGRTYFFTRRCTQREFILRPDEDVNAALTYCLGRAAAETGVQIHSFLAMSNHVHATVTDPGGVMPDFARRFASLAARMINRARGRWENLWVPGDTSYVHCVETRDVVDKTVYTLANPVADQLVDKAIHWPGVSTFAWLDGRTVIATRPRGFAHPDRTVLPDEVRIQLTAPPSWPGSFAEWAAAVRAGVELEERNAAERRAATGDRILGRKAILAASPTGRPKTLAPRRRMKPRIAAKNLLARRAAIDALKQFRHAYALAREAFLAGKRDVAFPPGTWFMVRRWGAELASSSAPFVPS